jgi:hypothetical protein
MCHEIEPNSLKDRDMHEGDAYLTFLGFNSNKKCYFVSAKNTIRNFTINYLENFCTQSGINYKRYLILVTSKTLLEMPNDTHDTVLCV